jgi:glycosyltransferase involved in cell wall biosynthesis
MKILIVTGIFPPDNGGPATYVPLIAQAASEAGHQVAVVTLAEKTRSVKPYSYPVYYIRRKMLKPFRFLAVIDKVIGLGKKSDMIFVNGLAFEAVTANLFLNKPLFLKITGDWAWETARNRFGIQDSLEDFQKNNHNLWTEILKRIRLFFVRGADCIITPSRYMSKFVKIWGGQDVRVIYNGIRLDPPRNRAGLARITARRKNDIILMVARLITLKNIDQVIGLLPFLNRQRLVIVGDGPERNNLEKLAKKLGVSGKVFFLGDRKPEFVASCMREAGLFILNSVHETFSHVILEAMAAGLPVIATAVGGNTEVIKTGWNGLLIPPDNPRACQLAIEKLVKNRSLSVRIAHNARKTARAFASDRMIKKTLGLFEKAGRLQRSNYP